MIDIGMMRRILRYEPETGRFYRRTRPQSDFPDAAAYRRWLSRYDGKEALFAKHAKGYRAGAIMGQMVLAHRAAWAMHYGAWPAKNLDHINGDKTDNRISNLRECTLSENQGNSSSRGGTSRYKGVHLRKRDGKWVSAITIDGRYTHIGVYSREIDAAKAYDEAAKSYFGDFSKPNLPA